MAQQTDPHLTDREQAILDAAVRECGLPGFADALGSRDAWGDRVQIAFASDDRRLLLKQWPVYCRTDDEIGNVIALQDMVREAGVPVPRLLRTEAGSRVFDWSDARFSIAEFVGDAYDPEQPSQKIECARMLGRFHAAVADVRYHTDWGRDPVWISRNHLRRMAESAEADGSPSTVSKAVTDAARGMDALLVVAEKRLDQYGWRELHRIPVHGDYHHFNCRFDGSEVVAVVDFDNSRLEPRPYDVAYAIGMILSLDWRVEPTGARWRDCRVPDDASLSCWLRAYLTEAPPLTHLERRLLPTACAMVWPECIHGFCPRDLDEAPGCTQVVSVMQAFLNDPPSLADALV